MGQHPTWLARLREAFVEQGVFSLKPLPKTLAEADLDAAAGGTTAHRPEVRLGLDNGPSALKRPDSL
jgi:hypothetical protein